MIDATNAHNLLQPDLEANQEFKVEIEGYSGPLDMLCHMVEKGEIEASGIKISELITIYASYLTQSCNVPIASVANFILQTAKILLQKTISLSPKKQSQDEKGSGELVEEMTLQEILERYKPYRIAIARLENLKEEASKRFFRARASVPALYDFGDLYSLSCLWVDLLNSKRKKKNMISLEDELFDLYANGIPEAIPEEIHVESRMELILEKLGHSQEGIYLHHLITSQYKRRELVVTLLAILELSRKNFIALCQEEIFAHVLIRLK